MHRLTLLGIQLVDSPKGGLLVKHRLDSFLFVDMKSNKHLDPILIQLNEYVLKKYVEVFSRGEIGYLYTKVGFVFRMCMT